EGILQVRADRQTHRPYGLAGGGEGAAGRNLLNPDTPAEQGLHAKLTMTFRAGEVFRHQLPGGGGFGDPLARDPAAVAKDLRDGLVTVAGAARDYGVVAQGDPPQVDVAATAALRAARRGAAA
ncbi:MAG: hydantoinase B/oxoprolinase family protein, partial [Rhodospirillales bacterium]|nr:hydantoinase B/oxoprolinase family protein [Rhodospirillales bacterium]